MVRVWVGHLVVMGPFGYTDRNSSVLLHLPLASGCFRFINMS